MFNLFGNRTRRGDEPHMLVVGMTGVRLGERLAQIGCAHGGRLAAVAKKVGLSGRAVAFVPDDASAARARKGAAQAGVLVEIETAPPTRLPADEAAFDLVVVDDTDGLLGSMSTGDRAATIREVLRLLRPGGRAIVIGNAPRSGLGRAARARSSPSALRCRARAASERLQERAQPRRTRRVGVRGRDQAAGVAECSSAECQCSSCIGLSTGTAASEDTTVPPGAHPGFTRPPADREVSSSNRPKNRPSRSPAGPTLRASLLPRRPENHQCKSILETTPIRCARSPWQRVCRMSTSSPSSVGGRYVPYAEALRVGRAVRRDRAAASHAVDPLFSIFSAASRSGHDGACSAGAVEHAASGPDCRRRC